MKTATIITLFLTFVYLVSSASQAMAVSPADFPACSNPQGLVLADYDSGTHGIVGNSDSYTGSDKVYKIDEQKVTQCFCPSQGSTGIQTDWFKAGSLSQDEIKTYEHDGWTYIPTGKSWGLSDEPYLAKNHDYTCSGSSNGSGDSQSGGGSNGISSGIVEASSAILGLASLASTGNTITLLGIALTGLVAFSFSFFLKKTK